MLHCPQLKRRKSIIRFLKKVIYRQIKKINVPKAKITPRSGHDISREKISSNALKVLYRLQQGGFDAFLVGGSVRDLLLGLKPKDFDVATNAHPEQIQALFRNCRLIGRRFRLAHIYFRDGIIEVATFRAQEDDSTGDRHTSETGMIIRDNIYGTLESDAWQRDFTINALYYNIADFSVVDFAGGMRDLKHRLIRMIGDPIKRYHEDPVRMLRAVRFAAKLGLKIHQESEQPIFEFSGLLLNVPPARLFEEIVKIFFNGSALASFDLLRHYGLFALLFSQTEACLVDDKAAKIFHQLLIIALTQADQRFAQGKTLNPAFLFAVLLWEPLQRVIRQYQQNGMKLFPALHLAMEKVIQRQNKSLNLPRRYTTVTKEIWLLQFRLAQRVGKRISSVLYHARFRAAYDLLELRSKAGEPVSELSDWWTKFQVDDETVRQNMLSELHRSHRKAIIRDKDGKR